MEYKRLIRMGELALPDRILDLSVKPKSQTTVLLTLNKRWKISFRIHSVENKVKPSLTFDIGLIDYPQQLSRDIL